MQDGDGTVERSAPHGAETRLPAKLLVPPVDLTEELLERREVYRGRIVRLHVDTVRMPSAHTASREVVDHPGAVAILPVTPEGHAVLVWQYRYAALRPLLEIPAGKLDPQESPEACAVRELAEETGYRAGRLTHIATTYPSPGFSGEALHLYMAWDLTPGPAHPDEDELLCTVEATPAEVDRMLREGYIADLKTLAALAWWRGVGGELGVGGNVAAL